jgi:hypothetical protein
MNFSQGENPLPFFQKMLKIYWLSETKQINFYWWTVIERYRRWVPSTKNRKSTNLFLFQQDKYLILKTYITYIE